MSKIFPLVLLAISFLISCVGTDTATKSTVRQQDTLTSLPFAPIPDTLINQLEGYWLSEPFISEIERKKSIYASSRCTTHFLCIQFFRQNLSGTTPELYGFHDHEGLPSTPIRYNPATKQLEADLNRASRDRYLEGSFDIQLQSPQLSTLNLLTQNKKETYRKVVDEHTELRRVLFAGTYTDLLTNAEISFDENGSVKGLEDKSAYELFYDFSENLYMDIVFLTKKTDKDKFKHLYHYKITGDTLSIFQVDASLPEPGTLPDYSIGKLRYQLIRKKK